MKWLRQKLEDNPRRPRHLITESGMGYRFQPLAAVRAGVSGAAGTPSGMAEHRVTLEGGTITGRGRSLNPFAILEDAAGFIAFAEHVFDAVEVAQARTPTPAGRLIHAELRVGDSLLLLADPQEGWSTQPGMFQLWGG